MANQQSPSAGPKPAIAPKPKVFTKPLPPRKPPNLHILQKSTKHPGPQSPKQIEIKKRVAAGVISSHITTAVSNNVFLKCVSTNGISTKHASIDAGNLTPRRSVSEDITSIENNNNALSENHEYKSSRSSGYLSASLSGMSSETNGWSPGNQSPVSLTRNQSPLSSTENHSPHSSTGNQSPVSSAGSSDCSDIPNHCGFDETDILAKLSDLECSERSSSASPFLGSEPPYSPTDTLPSPPVYPSNSCFANGLTKTNVESFNSNDGISDSKRKKIYNIANEIMTSEGVFCKVLKLLNEDFRQFVIKKKCIASNSSKNPWNHNLPEDELNKILNYLPQLQNFSESFTEDLKQRLADWEKHRKIADIIVTKGPFLKLYSSYIKDFELQCSLLDEARTKYSKFNHEVSSFEASEKCSKLGIKHYMLKPIQRIPQYRLLFQSYLDLLPENSPDLQDSHKALAILEGVANHANNTIKIEDSVSELLSLQRRLYSSDGVQPELMKPGRRLLKQGELVKLSRRVGQPRYFVLLSDGLLYTSYSSSATSMLRLNTELPLEGMKITHPIADDFRAEFTIRATQRSFTVRAKDEAERTSWITALQAAIDANIQRRSTFIAANMAAFAAPSVDELGKQAPVWVPDYRVTMCQVCTAEFSLMFRRHHCRSCGKVVCDLCSSNRAPLEYKKNQPERVCDGCYEILLKQLEERISKEGEDSKEEGLRQKTATELRKLKQGFKRGIKETLRSKCNRRPERLLEVSASDAGSQMRGYLRRNGRRGWFVLKDSVLYGYAAPADVCALESLPVLGYKLLAGNGEGGEVGFRLTHPNQEDIFFTAETQDSANKWIAAMNEAIVL